MAGAPRQEGLPKKRRMPAALIRAMLLVACGMPRAPEAMIPNGTPTGSGKTPTRRAQGKPGAGGGGGPEGAARGIIVLAVALDRLRHGRW